MNTTGLRFAVGLTLFAVAAAGYGHGGGLDGMGCHNDRKRGGYHCHRGTLAGKSFSSKSGAIAALRGRGAAEAPPVGQRRPQRLTSPGTITLSRPVVSSKDLVTATQYLLAALGYDPGPADGQVGSKTEAAIRSFQRAQLVPVDGQASGRLLVKLSQAVLVRR